MERKKEIILSNSLRVKFTPVQQAHSHKAYALVGPLTLALMVPKNLYEFTALGQISLNSQALLTLNS